jgi:PAS domain S-box-containing protein
MQVLDHAAIGIAVLDSAGRILHANAHLAKLTARSPAELAERGLAGILHPDDWSGQQLRAAEVARGERPELHLEPRCLLPDGSTVLLSVTLSRLPDESGARALAIVEDVTARRLEEEGERRRAEERLQSSEWRFEKFMQHLPGLAWIKDLEGRYVYVNDAAERAFQRDRETLYGRRDDELFPAATSRAFRANDARALSSEMGLQTIETLEHADGVHHSFVSKFAIPAADGTPGLLGGIAIDVTDRIAAEAALQETERRFRDMADHAPVLIWLNGREGCDFVNREYLRFLGASLEEVRGDGWRRFIHPDDCEAYVADYARCVALRCPFEAQFRFRRADGEYRWLRSTGVPRLHADGTLTGYVGCSVDITDIKRSEQALQEADRRKDEFLATLAHELRNPLAPIRSALEVLRRSGSASPDLYRMLARQVDQLVRLVEDLLDVSRITRGQIALKRERVALADVVHSAIETAKPQLDAARHALQVALPEEPLWLDADPLRLSQVLVNLLNNAALYTPDGGRIEIGAERRGSEVTVSVRDDGIGIAADALPRVFDPFTRFDRASGRAQGGLGIGLALAAQIAALHGGRVEARSDGPGRGSEFRLRLPLAFEAAAGADGAETAPPPTATLRGPVLVVDDNRDGAEALAMLLRLRGLRAEIALDGDSALRMARSLEPAVVLLDLGMPGMDGFEVARRLRAEPTHRGQVLVALTGWNQAEIVERCAQAGFDHHLVKPVQLEALEALLAAR